MLLEHRKAQYEGQDEEHELSEVFTKTLDYCQTFSKYSSRETIQAVRGTLQKQKLHKFEIASLANLIPSSAEEAQTHLPSLEGRFDEVELNELLDEIRTHMNYQY